MVYAIAINESGAYALAKRCGKMAPGSNVGYALSLSTKPAKFERE